MSIHATYTEDQLRAYIADMELKHSQLLAEHSQLQARYERLKQSKDLLLNTIIDKEAKQKKYTTIIENSPGALFLSKLDGTIIETNHTASIMFGYSEEEFKQLNRTQILDANESNFKDLLDERKNTRKSRQILTAIRKNNTRFQVDVSSILFVDPFTGEDRACTVLIDITDRIQAEIKLEAERKHLRILIDNLPDAIYIKDANARKVITNKVDMAFMGVSSEEDVIGKTDVEIFEGEIGVGGYNDDMHILQTGEAIYNSEQFFVGINGEVNWLLTSKVPLLDESGKISGLLGIGRVITERKKAEELLAKERKLLRVLIDNLPDYIYIKDLQSRHIINNKSNTELLGFTSESETLGKSVADLLGIEMAREFIKDDLQVFQSGEPIINREEPINNKYGEQRWLLTTKIPLKDDSAQIVGLVGISRDITEQKLAAEELKEKNIQLKDLSNHLQNVREEERKSIAREIHDELGQLASVIKMDIDWLKLRMTDLKDAQQKRIDHALSTSDLLLSSIRKIAFALRPTMLDELGLNASIEWQCKEFARINGIPCVFEHLCDDQGLSVPVKTELFRICQESLTNIMRHAKATHVIVTIRQIQGSKQLTIADNGIGFDTTKKKNTLGLIGMRERALSVNGELTVKSEPGKGTIVSVAIPKIIYPI